MKNMDYFGEAILNLEIRLKDQIDASWTLAYE